MYKERISPILDRFDSETTHIAVREALHWAEITPFGLKVLERLFADRHARYFHEKLCVCLGSIAFENPLMVGAGWDKEGRAVKALWQLGFAGVEVGGVLQYPQPGNSKPRQFILAPGVALNRLGFNSGGMEKVARNLQRYKRNKIPIGINVGKNKDVPLAAAPEAYAAVVRRLYHRTAYFAINVSSPNTPGLRTLQDKGPLSEIIQAVNQVMIEMGGRKPVFVKIAPELTNQALDDVIQVVLDHGLTGIIATNTTNNPETKAKYGKCWGNEAGGLSGDDQDFRRMATEKVAYIWKATGGKIGIMGVGGVKDTATALEKLMAGATVIQIVTGIRGEGPTLPGKINRGLVRWMEKNGVNSIQEIIGQT